MDKRIAQGEVMEIEAIWRLVEYFIAVPILALLLLLLGYKRHWSKGAMIVTGLSVVFSGYVYFQLAHTVVDVKWIQETAQSRFTSACQRKAILSAPVKGMTAKKLAEIRNNAKCD